MDGIDGSPEARSDPEAYTGSGGWGIAALVLLGGLFVVAMVATAHSMLVTFG